MAVERLNGKRVQVIADVERAYWQIYRLDRLVELTRENRRLLEDLEHVVNARYQGRGRCSSRTCCASRRNSPAWRDDEHRYQFRRSAAAAALNQLTNHPPQREIPTTEPIDEPTIRADVDELIALAAEYNPELAALRQQVDRDREQVELANLGCWPDITVGFEWNYVDPRARRFIPPVNPTTGMRPPVNRKSEAGDDNWAITVQANIPIWSQRIEAAKREARQTLLATQSELRSTENMIAFRIFDAWSRIEAQQQTLRVLEAEIIPQSRQTYEVTLTAYQAGRADFLALIDNWRSWLHFKVDAASARPGDLETAFRRLAARGRPATPSPPRRAERTRREIRTMSNEISTTTMRELRSVLIRWGGRAGCAHPHSRSGPHGGCRQLPADLPAPGSAAVTASHAEEPVIDYWTCTMHPRDPTAKAGQLSDLWHGAVAQIRRQPRAGCETGGYGRCRDHSITRASARRTIHRQVRAPGVVSLHDAGMW